MTSVLFVVSEEGYWGEECVDPLETLSDTDADVDVATPSGNKPVVDDRSIDPENVGEETAEWVKEVHRNDQRLQNPKPIATADADQYDAVVFPGGHGTNWDVNQDKHARRLLRKAVEGDDDRKALVVCHAVGLLAFTRDGDGGMLVEGRDVTGFPNEWEEDIVDDHDLMPDGRKLPYWVEDEVRAAGANWDAELDADASVTVDGDLITARGPESSHEGVMALIEALGVAPPA
ncbi:type 1 glutamine amidotransferase domain-containing protein [Halorussus gelatinilyticus]|uniref:Type 1 glutamine amidotransferase domain-containing protein n=1 Tax=Halorussus gelatinilyticus TaxID=2937524 RepID=A0A8U0IFV8_9EURY|nr:type 1 glutamine amidotransferase domain-containing protein [Halorussus gelatinilyticus]UPV99624.1 type 1 glutamine amidotransferase domain-containing protein [Halorussus gelatinilyticus]